MMTPSQSKNQRVRTRGVVAEMRHLIINATTAIEDDLNFISRHASKVIELLERKRNIERRLAELEKAVKDLDDAENGSDPA